MPVLGIETSCDETGVGIYDIEHGLLAHCLYSQECHVDFGGIVPELASRDHIRKLLPLIKQTLAMASCDRRHIDAVAYTAGPGLIGALLVGAMFAKSLAWSWAVPAVPIHHMEAHLLAVFLEQEIPKFPFIALLVSGGHTLLIQVSDFGDYRLLGETVDDAVGEAFDKTARLLGLPYPGGAALARIAQNGAAFRYHFPRPMVNRSGLDFSFSGLKTFALQTWQKSDKSEQTKADIAWAFEQAVAETLTIKCRRALQATGLSRLVVAGGVAANQTLKNSLQRMTKKESAGLYFPRSEFCTDNGAMIALCGAYRLAKGKVGSADQPIRARWPIDNI